MKSKSNFIDSTHSFHGVKPCRHNQHKDVTERRKGRREFYDKRQKKLTVICVLHELRRIRLNLFVQLFNFTNCYTLVNQITSKELIFNIINTSKHQSNFRNGYFLSFSFFQNNQKDLETTGPVNISERVSLETVSLISTVPSSGL